MPEKFKAFGYEVFEVDGHNIYGIQSALDACSVIGDKPYALICHTIKGKGFAFAENNPHWHHKSKLTKDEIEAMHLSLMDSEV